MSNTPRIFPKKLGQRTPFPNPKQSFGKECGGFGEFDLLHTDESLESFESHCSKPTVPLDKKVDACWRLANRAAFFSNSQFFPLNKKTIFAGQKIVQHTVFFSKSLKLFKISFRVGWGPLGESGMELRMYTYYSKLNCELAEMSTFESEGILSKSVSFE